VVSDYYKRSWVFLYFVPSFFSVHTCIYSSLILAIISTLLGPYNLLTILCHFFHLFSLSQYDLFCVCMEPVQGTARQTEDGYCRILRGDHRGKNRRKGNKKVRWKLLDWMIVFGCSRLIEESQCQEEWCHWWLNGRFGALHLEGRKFESHSSRHVGTLGKCFTRSCL